MPKYQFEVKKEIKNCLDCKMRYYSTTNHYCIFAKRTVDDYIFRSRKPSWCPLVEVESEEVPK